MPKPTSVTILSSQYIGVKCQTPVEIQKLRDEGFKPDDIIPYLFFFSSTDIDTIFRMCERLRDWDIPFATHRTGGADHAVETFRERGRLSGAFKRINFFGNDIEEDTRFAIEEF